MKKCINCGNNENNNAVACSRCGGPLMKNSKTCWSCGAEIDNDVAFCTSCGAAMENAVPPAPYLYERAELPEKKSKGKGAVIALIITICVLLAACIVLAAYLLIGKNDDSVQNGNNTNNSQQQQSQGENGNPGDEKQDGSPEDSNSKRKVSTYHVYKNDSNWTAANSAAVQMGGNLVCINSREEFDKVCAMADAQNIKVFWMGARRDYNGQSWYDVAWSTGDEMTYTKWYTNEPSYVEDGVPEMYLMAFKVKGEWYYNDGINDISGYYAGKMGYIVEFEE